ncbi:MAG: hypothetical protein ABI217_09230 [Chthoniobacterales bacterium]
MAARPAATGKTHRRLIPSPQFGHRYRRGAPSMSLAPLAPFWKYFAALPTPVQKLAREKYVFGGSDPYHASFHFEERRNGICVIRIGGHYRAVGLREGDAIAWFWIGTHEEYNGFRFEARHLFPSHRWTFATAGRQLRLVVSEVGDLQCGRALGPRFVGGQSY